MRPLALIALLALVASGVACSDPPPPAAGGPPTAAMAPTDRDVPRPVAGPRGAPAPTRRVLPDLQARLDALVTDPSLHVDAPVGIVVVDPRGYPVLRSSEERPLMPASTLKIVTAAAALLELGPEHRFITELRATAPIGPDGVIEGDLVIVGSGDPALATPSFAERAYPDRPRTPLEDLVDAALAAGIHHVTGSVVGDPSVFADEPLARGWTERYLRDLDTAYVSGLTVDAGRDVTYHEDGRAIGSPSLDPAATTATRLSEMLAERGVTVTGAPRSAAHPEADVLIGTAHSPPLARILRYLIIYSDNQLTDGIFRILGAGDGPSTWRSSAAAVRDALAALPLDWDGIVLADGSGLSRLDRVTASFLAQLDRAMYLSPYGSQWHDIMAVSGSSGTMRRRLRGTIAAGLLRGKTGTLDDVRAFVGAVEAPSGRYHLAVIGNELDGADRDRVRLLQDEIALLLTEELLGCERTPVEVTPSPGATPPSTARLEGNRVVCPG